MTASGYGLFHLLWVCYCGMLANHANYSRDMRAGIKNILLRKTSQFLCIYKSYHFTQHLNPMKYRIFYPEIQNFSSNVEKHFISDYSESNTFQHNKGNLVSLGGHVTISLSYKHQWNTNHWTLWYFFRFFRHYLDKGVVYSVMFLHKCSPGISLVFI